MKSILFLISICTLSSCQEGEKKANHSSVSYVGCRAFMANESYNCSTRALMSTIAHAEGTKTLYNISFTYKSFSSYQDHPRRIYCTQNRALCSDAAGRYQFLSKTWDDIRRNIRLDSFAPYFQDKAGVYLTEVRRGVRNHSLRLNKSQFSNVMYKLRYEWASLPYSPYGQPVHSLDGLWRVYQQGF